MTDREFSVRAWDKNLKVMVYGPGPCDSWLGPQMTFDGRIYESVKSDVPGMGMYKYRDLIILPWCGLIDSDAEKIYEGDILGGHYDGGYIAFCDSCKSFQYHVCNECFACSGDVHWYELAEDDGDLVVLGNIYENPNFLAENQP